MSTELRPLPIPDLQTEPFWAWARRGELRLPRCPECHRYAPPWSPCCPECLNLQLQWAQVSGRGVIHSWCVMWGDYVPGFSAPYVVVEVAIVEQPDVLLVANIMDTDPAPVVIGEPVQVVFEERGDFSIPQFARARSPW